MIMQTNGRKVQLSATVRPELKELVHAIATETNTNISNVVTQCLEEFAQRRMTALMEEGYKAMAKEHKNFAKLSAKAASEVIPDW